MNQDERKQAAADYALRFIQSGMILGLGSGSTAERLLHAIAAATAAGQLHGIIGVPTSERTAHVATSLGIALATPDAQPAVDLAIDGADEIDPDLNLIKGLGGALLREKIVAGSAAQFMVIGDESKLVAQLGERSPVPVEVSAFGVAPTARQLVALGGEPLLRRTADGAALMTDEGHMILDTRFGPIADVRALAARLAALPGVMAHGIFAGMASRVVVAGSAGVRVLERP